jgi:hypothetical protein
MLPDQPSRGDLVRHHRDDADRRQALTSRNRQTAVLSLEGQPAVRGTDLVDRVVTLKEGAV